MPCPISVLPCPVVANVIVTTQHSTTSYVLVHQCYIYFVCKSLKDVFFWKNQLWASRGSHCQLYRRWKKTDQISMKYGRALWRPFECDYNCKDSFNLSLRLKAVCGFRKKTHTSQFCSFFHQNVGCTVSEVSVHSCTAVLTACKCLSSENVNWIDVVDVFFR